VSSRFYEVLLRLKESLFQDSAGGTITNQLRPIMDKLGVASRAELVIVVLSAARAAEKSSER
jgi:hypothetical protein